MAARSSLLRRPTPGAHPARRTSSVVAALAALAPRLVRLAHHDYPDGLLARCASAPGVVLPGVGAFGACMANLTSLGLVEPVKHAIRAGRPFLGICLGMQLLFEESEEFGPVAGLGILPGRVVRFAADPARKVPHMGWNALRIVRAAPALAGIDDGAYVYFVHSYYPVPGDPALVASTTPYGPEFASSVVRDNVFACQFHPEKSQQVGLR